MATTATVCNISQYSANKWNSKISNTIWISIRNPGLNSSIVHNVILENIPCIILSFWDFSETFSNKTETFQIAKESDAKLLVDFIMLHKDKDVIVNCTMGISRSGAIAKFCENQLNYIWPDAYKKSAIPNDALYTLMTEYYKNNYNNCSNVNSV